MVDIIDDWEQIIINIETAGVEDLTTYTLVPGAYLSVNPSNRVNFTGLPRNAPAPYPYLQSPLFNLTDFELRYHLHVSELQDPPLGGGGTSYSGGFITSLLTRDITHITYQHSACPNGDGFLGNGLGLTVRSYWHGAEAQPKHIFGVFNNDNTLCPNPPPGTDRFEFVYWWAAPNTAPPVDIYIKLIKTGTNATVWLYSDIEMTKLLLDYRGIPFPEAGKIISNININPYLYLVPAGCRGSGDSRTITGYMENFQLL